MRQILVIGHLLDPVDNEHRRHGLPRVVLPQRAVQGTGDGLSLQFGIGQLALGLRHLEFDVEAFALGDHAVLFERDGIFEVAAYAVDHLPAHLDDLHGECQPEVALHELRNQRVAGLVALLLRRAFVDPGGAVGGVDLAAQPDGHRDLPAHEPEALILHLEEPVGVHQRIEQPVDRGDHFGRYEPAAEYLPGELFGRAFHLVEIESYILGHIGVCAHDADLGHTQADGRTAFLGGGLLLELGPLLAAGGKVADHGDRLVERERTLGLLRRQPDDGRKCRRRKEGSDCYFHINQCVYGANI